MANEQALADQSRTTWIPEAEWRALLRDSEQIQAKIKVAETYGQTTAHLWEKLRPIAEAIRSPRVRVRGIDDLTPEERRLKAMKCR